MNQLQKAQTDPYAVKSYENIRGEILHEKAALAEKIRAIETENPIAFRAGELVSYNKGLRQEGHIAPVPSVKYALSEIGSRMISGKPMFLHGPTGGGKTSLARFAAKHFTNKDAEMVYCTPQTREANIWGKTGIRPAGGGAIETVDIYGPLAKAMQEGKTVIFDEFTALPKEQMVFIKGIFNAKIGDSVNVVGNGKTKIANGFQMIFTANLKSEKNPERQELPPEIAREFEQNNLKIDYTPKDEAYDIMLARLMNKDGSVDMSYYDLNETLPKFAEAIAEVQIAYTNKESDVTARLTGTKDASGKTRSLKKLVLTQGTVENIIDAWKIEKKTNKSNLSFVEFLDSRLKRVLTFEEYPEKDRILAAKILASKGFLRTLSAKDLNLPQEIFAVDAIKKLRGEEAAMKTKSKSADEKRVPLKELADFDPFGKRQKKTVEQAMHFLSESGEKSKEAAGEAREEF
ncbi:MAG: AAA family ATPase, partial [Patescibacteria group bacterium]